MKTAKQIKSQKPRELKLCNYGVLLTVKADSKMTNMWIEGFPLDAGKAKQLHTWLTKYIKYVESLKDLK